jgi:uncharacterized membrane protein
MTGRDRSAAARDHDKGISMASTPIVGSSPGITYPLHVILAAYPIACFTGAFLTDIVYARSYDMQWANFSVWLITAGLVMGALAALAGIVDLVFGKKVRADRMRWPHTIGNIAVLLLSLWNVLIHSRDAYTSVVPTGIILSGIVALLVLVINWWGTALTFRHAGAAK